MTALTFVIGFLLGMSAGGGFLVMTIANIKFDGSLDKLKEWLDD